MTGVACGNLIARIQALIDDDSDETKIEILQHMNAEYLDLCGLRNWNCLMKQITIPASRVLPADVLRLVYVQDDTDFIYFTTNLVERYRPGSLYNWFNNLVDSTPELEVNDAVIAENGTSLSSVTGGFTAAMVGEWVRIGTNVGVYEISAHTDTNNVTLADGYRGEAETGAHLEVRPRGTKQILLTDEQGSAIASTTALLWYVRRPLPLHNDYDQVMLPGSCEALRIRTLQRLLEQNKYDVDAQRQIGNYQMALSEMRSLDQRKFPDMVPRNPLHQRARYGRWR